MCLLMAVATNFIFIKDVSRYWFISQKIHSIEREGERAIYTKDGEKNGWDNHPELKKAYDECMQKKKELIKSSDVAKWVAISAETVTGQVIRLIAILVSVSMTPLAVTLLIRILLEDMRFLMKKLRIN